MNVGMTSPMRVNRNFSMARVSGAGGTAVCRPARYCFLLALPGYFRSTP